jgi:hypothetical protein
VALVDIGDKHAAECGAARDHESERRDEAGEVSG